jgi:hypothetical protein
MYNQNYFGLCWSLWYSRRWPGKTPCSLVQMCQHFGENYDGNLHSRVGRVIGPLPWRYTRLNCVISHKVVLLTNVEVCLKATLHSDLNLYFTSLFVFMLQSREDCINTEDGNSKFLETSVTICRSTRRHIPQKTYIFIYTIFQFGMYVFRIGFYIHSFTLINLFLG